MNFRFRAGVFSVLLHLALAILLLGVPLPQRFEEIKVEMELKPMTAAPSVRNGVGKRGSSKRQGLARFFRSHDEFLSSLNAEEKEPRLLDGEDLEKSLIDKNWSDTWAYTNPDSLNGAFFQERGRSLFYEQLHEKIERALANEATPLLSEFNHSGRVFLRFAVNPDGVLFPDSLAARSDDAIIKVRSARALRKSLKNPVEPMWRMQGKKDKRLWITARFLWIDRRQCGASLGDDAPYMTFCIHTVNKRYDFSESGRLKQLASIAISSTGPFGWAEEYREYKQRAWRKDTEFDPFEREKRYPDYQL